MPATIPHSVVASQARPPLATTQSLSQAIAIGPNRAIDVTNSQAADSASSQPPRRDHHSLHLGEVPARQTDVQSDRRDQNFIIS